MPMQRRLPKVGFRSKIKNDTAEVLLYQLDTLKADEIDFAALRAAKLVDPRAKHAKIVKKGELTKKFVTQGRAATAGAKAAIEAAGGSVRSNHVAQANAEHALGGLGKFTELRQRLLFVLVALIVYRIGCFIPVPGVNPDAMLTLMEAQKGAIVDMFNMFSGGALQRFSLFALNVVPYISASIIVQLMARRSTGRGRRCSNEGESGRRKLTQYSRFGAVVLAVFQAFGARDELQSSRRVVYDPGPGFVLTATVVA